MDQEENQNSLESHSLLGCRCRSTLSEVPRRGYLRHLTPKAQPTSPASCNMTGQIPIRVQFPIAFLTLVGYFRLSSRDPRGGVPYRFTLHPEHFQLSSRSPRGC